MDHQQLKIWFAAFYEGEGCICNDINNRNRLRIMISQNDKTPLILGQSIWGGTVKEKIVKSPASDKICHGHEWRLNHNDSIKFISDIKPFMIIPYKIQQMKNCEEKLNTKWDRRFKCSVCEKDFADSSGRRRHEKQFHLEPNEFVKLKCDNCDKVYASLDSLKRHNKLKH